MPEENGAQKPFESFSFTLIDDKCPRRAFRMSYKEDDLYELHAEKGSAANPSSQFTRLVPLERAQQFKDGLQAAGVFGWDEAYGDATAPGSRRWSVSTVFKEGVFSVASRGGSDVPLGFDAMLEELYRLDFPRPAEPSVARAGAAAFGTDYSAMAAMMNDGGLEGFDVEQMATLMNEARSNPQAFQMRMREEFARMSHDEQERMLDMLASSGMASRAWWERFLRG